MASKLGPHVIRPTGDALDWARHAPVVKVLDDTSALRAASRATVRIFRRYFPDQDARVPGGALVDAVLTSLGDAPATHVEIFNECFQRLGQGLERYVDFTAEAVRRLRERRPDLTLVAFCFSTGNPEPEDWAYLRQHEYGGASVVGLHEYWGSQGFSGWNALRYRKVHEWTGGDHPLFLITECGRDRVEGGKGGYRADGVSAEQYHRELLAFEAELMTDGYVIAATPFTAGPTPDWSTFDTDPLSGWLVSTTGPLPTPVPSRPQEAPMPDWYPAAARKAIAVNYTAGRGGLAPRLIVDHVADGSGSPFGWFNTDRGENGSSAHFWVSKAGRVEQYRPLGDTCWANGPINHPDLSVPAVARIVQEGVNPNRVTVAIEHEGKPGDVFPAAQVAASRALHAWLAEQYGIPLGRAGVVGHYQFDSVTRPNCPGPSFPWTAILAKEAPMPDPTPTVTDLQERAWALGDQLQQLEAGYQRAGYPHRAAYVRTQGEAIKEWVNTASKGQQ